MAKLKTIIIDDVQMVRTELKFLLQEYEEIEVVGEAGNINQAIELVNKVQPDLIFLDIQLKEESGFDLIEKVDICSKIIFITAYEKYAIRAFEVNALDYLLKPIAKDRLAKALQRVIPNSVEKEPVLTQNQVNYDDVIYLMIDGCIKFIKVNLIKCIIAEGKYSYIICNANKKQLVSKKLHEWEEILPQRYFIRVHRSTIINLKYVNSSKKNNNYTYEVNIEDIEEPFRISRRYAVKIKNKLGW